MLCLQKKARVVSIDDYEDVHPNNESALQAAVARQPVSVAIEAGGRIFQFYKSVGNIYVFRIYIYIYILYW